MFGLERCVYDLPTTCKASNSQARCRTKLPLPKNSKRNSQHGQTNFDYCDSGRDDSGSCPSTVNLIRFSQNKTWSKEFLPLAPPQLAKKREDSFLNDLMGLPSKDAEKDEFESYAHSGSAVNLPRSSL
jgi:hypothetical protein